MRKIVLLGEVGEYLDEIKRDLPGWEVVSGGDTPSTEDAEIIYGWAQQLDRETLERTSKLKWIQTTGAGVNSLPLDILKAKGIILTNASGVHAYPISESLIGMVLGFARNLFLTRDDQKKNLWSKRASHGMTEIHGKTIGILGVGAIGQEVARLAKAFQMRTLGFRRTGEPADYVDVMYDGDGLHRLLAESDYVVSVLPGTDAAKNIVGRAEFAAMKPTAFYLNAGRGSTTDTEALIDALRAGQIAGAGLDVTEPEPLPADSPLWQMDNVFISPHVTGGTDRYTERTVAILRENLAAYLAEGRPVKNLVDLDLQY